MRYEAEEEGWVGVQHFCRHLYVGNIDIFSPVVMSGACLLVDVILNRPSEECRECEEMMSCWRSLDLWGEIMWKKRNRALKRTTRIRGAHETMCRQYSRSSTGFGTPDSPVATFARKSLAFSSSQSRMCVYARACVCV